MRTIRGRRPDSGITLVEVLVAIFVLAELESIRALEHQGYRVILGGGPGVTHLRAASWGPNRIDLFARGGGAGTDPKAVYHRWSPPAPASRQPESWAPKRTRIRPRFRARRQGRQLLGRIAGLLTERHLTSGPRA
jgi:hypothetical protein